MASHMLNEKIEFAPQRRGGRREELKFISRDLSALMLALRCKPSPISSSGARLMKGAGCLPSLVMKEHNSFAPQRREGRREEWKFISRDLSALMLALRCNPPITGDEC